MPDASIPPSLRPGRDDDADDLVRLIGAVFSEYPGCVLDVDGEMPELRAIASHFEQVGGKFWVAERPSDARVVGCVGVKPMPATDRVELVKLYVASSEREAGVGGRLVELVEEEARRRGVRFVELWSDTRFETAHRFYERRGYERQPETRELHDKSDTVEFRYAKKL